MGLSDDIYAIPKLFGDAVEQLGKLVQNEAQLAKAKLSQKITQAAIGAAYLGGAAVPLHPGIGGSAEATRSARSAVVGASSATLRAASNASSAVTNAAADAVDAMVSIVPGTSGRDAEGVTTAAANPRLNLQRSGRDSGIVEP